MAALYKNDTAHSAEALKKWLGTYPNSLHASVTYSSILRKLKRYSEAEQFLAVNASVNASGWNKNEGVMTEAALVKFGLSKDDEADSILAPLLITDERLRSKYMYVAKTLLEMRVFSMSARYYEKGLALQADGDFYNLACAYALSGNKDNAFAALHKAADLGYNARQHQPYKQNFSASY